jgi:hypothetical protein
MPKRIRLSRARGFRLPEGAVNVARPGKRGNPFIVGKDGTRIQCVVLFAQLARGFIDLGGRIPPEDQLTMYRRLRRAATDIKGRDVACWCALDGPCHGDVWLHLANGGGYLDYLVGQEIELPRVRIGMAAWDFQKLRRKAAQA